MDELIERLMDENRAVSNLTERFLLLARDAIEAGDPEMGRACLAALCRSVGNYEESIAWNGLTDIWEKYKHLVEGLVEPSVRVMRIEPRAPGECTMSIGDILALPDDTVLSELSQHLQELSGEGGFLQSLNKWERAVFVVDELCMEVYSVGFYSYF